MPARDNTGTNVSIERSGLADNDSAAVQRIIGARAALTTALVLSLPLAACVSFSVTTTGAASVDDLAAENAYIAVYMDHMTKLAEDNKAFAPTASNPGPCNKGGSQQGCFEADARVIATLNSMLEALKTVNVPPRFVDADRLLRKALTRNVEGLELRNQALATGDNDLWHQHGPVLEEAQAVWTAAYAAFPDDHRPSLGP